ncbi:heme-degrading monooxygenase HmoA [Stackebrandtia albiflava]|uniref:Heme-degrading monooxygenase HmoA n=1 Tax=Stackebrandtia albiflava TaxID=406432 RepID=A0A562V1T1_9ACTN|nr:antibiotic biosynthesis monooxygenase [Stackebrandtia albiflava]TWJ11838.1 heme-degrading monooxygenase HmoA [Stackebrandtia albiflava]
MIVEYIRYRLHPDRIDEFADAWAAAAPLVRRNPHNRSLEVARCLDDPGVHTVRIIWDSREGHTEGFRGHADFEEFTAHVGRFHDAMEELRHYEVLGGI